MTTSSKLSEVHRFLNEERGISDETLEAFGVTDDGDFVSFPYGNVYKQRRHDADGTRHFRSPKGTIPGLFCSPAGTESGSACFLVEGETDALRLWQETLGCISVMAIPGVTAWKDEWADQLEQYEEVFVVLDNDADYKVAATVDRVWLAIRKAVGTSARRIELPDGINDLCEFFDTYNVESLRELADRSVERGGWHYKALDLTKAASKPDWLVEGLIAKGDLCMMIGEPGVGKSWLSMALAVAIAEGGLSFLGRTVSPESLRVLYVDEENPESLIPYRLKKLGLSGGMKNIRYLHQQGVRVDRHPEFILEEALDYSPALIVLDSLTRIHTKDENNAGEISGLFNDGIIPLARSTGATVLVLHHVNKTDSSSSFTRARGSSDLSGVIDSGLDIRASGDGLAVVQYKSRWTEAGSVIHTRIEDVDDKVVLTTHEHTVRF